MVAGDAAAPVLISRSILIRYVSGEECSSCSVALGMELMVNRRPQLLIPGGCREETLVSWALDAHDRT